MHIQNIVCFLDDFLNNQGMIKDFIDHIRKRLEQSFFAEL